jgi:hypothetical protein
MRDLMPRKDLVTDPVTGSTLLFREGTGRGGAVFMFEYRKTPANEPIRFHVVTSYLTDTMFERYCRKRSLPMLKGSDSSATWRNRLGDFAEVYGDFNRIEEWYLIGSEGRPLMAPPEAKRTWAGLALDEAQMIIDMFHRVYFELTARRPGVTSDDPAQRYYPDLLKFEPYDLPKQLIQERRAAPGEEI